MAAAGEMARLMRSVDWARTGLGPVDTWSTSLRTISSVVLGSRYPMLLWWGKDLIQLYNDAYRPILGDKHPSSLAAPGPEVWSEIWHILGPLADSVLQGGGATWNEHLLLPMKRKGYVEETYFTFSYSPVPDDEGRIGGVLVTCHETTEQVLNERQLSMLRDLATHAAQAKSEPEACGNAARIFSTNQADIPFSLLYLVNDACTEARLAATSGLDDYEGLGRPEVIPLQGEAAEHAVWPLVRTRPVGDELVLDLPPRRLVMPAGASGTNPSRAIVMPLMSAGQARPYGFLVAGVSNHRPLDARYLGLFRLACDQIVSALGNVHAFEEERRRAAALADLDRAKTTFFSNVSHEFRTPLTLILGPLEDALNAPGKALAGESLQTTYRNALRLLKLVNGLLDFSRIEAGRLRATYEPTDLCTLTAELAAVFRSAVERAGLELVVDCEPLPEPVFVDPQMWEKIVLNLISNAFKFTFAGKIAVSLRARAGAAELAVEDTGVGVPHDELPRLFERFHRVPGTKARTHEGSGIGLALVQELVRVHAGSITVQSELGKGSRFVVSLPFGTLHLAPERVVSTSTAKLQTPEAAAFAEEAMHWLPRDNEREPIPPLETDELRECTVLVADDNADMLAYVARLLGEHCQVHTVANGAQALEALGRTRFDLLLADVMMPEVDGFELLRALRSGAETQNMPVIMLSARAGEEARLEGLDAGADDYLIKPFSSRELIARVRTQLRLSKARHLTERLLARERAARESADQATKAKDEFLAMLGHELRNPLAPIATTLQVMRLRGMNTREQSVLERQVGNLTRLVDDLLDISRVTRGKVDLHKREVELSDLVGAAIETASPLLEGRRHELMVDVPRELAVNGDPQRLTQAISNLLSNASKYSDAGSVITISAARDGAFVELAVTDEGIGIAEDQQQRVFEPFFQQHQAIDRSHGGLGLGLTIVQSLVELHGGRVSVRSRGPGQGSTFVISLPAADAAETRAGAVSARQPSGTAAKHRQMGRVLVVDDNVDSAMVLSELLQLKGYEVKMAHDGPSALSLLDSFWPDIALLDLGLPVMDGYELAHELRQRTGPGRELRIVAVSGYGQQADRKRTAAAGFDAHLVKPVDFERLEDVMQQICAA